MKDNELVIQINDLSFRYDRDNVLENINLKVEQGSFLGIVGPNGSGKSTMIKLILRLLKLQEGEIFLFGQHINEFKDWEKVGFVSQKANSFNTGFPATVFEVVASGLTKKLGLFRRLNKDAKRKVEEAIKAVGMEKFTYENIGELSGGQQQRVFIGRALVSDPQLLILDEPTVGVDLENVNAFFRMVEQLNKQLKMTLIVVTHDFDSVKDKLTEIAVMNKQLIYYGPVDQYVENNFLSYRPGKINN